MRDPVPDGVGGQLCMTLLNEYFRKIFCGAGDNDTAGERRRQHSSVAAIPVRRKARHVFPLRLLILLPIPKHFEKPLFDGLRD